MSTIGIASEIRAELHQHRRRTRFRGQADYLETKDAFCARLEALVDQFVRASGTPPALSLVPGTRVFGRRTVHVVVRDRVPQRAARG